MVSFCMCQTVSCKRWDECARAQAVPNAHWQAFAEFKEYPNCDSFIPLRSKDEQTKEKEDQAVQPS